jgi:hypothetical protein
MEAPRYATARRPSRDPPQITLEGPSRSEMRSPSIYTSRTPSVSAMPIARTSEDFYVPPALPPPRYLDSRDHAAASKFRNSPTDNHWESPFGSIPASSSLSGSFSIRDRSPLDDRLERDRRESSTTIKSVGELDSRTVDSGYSSLCTTSTSFEPQS